MTAAKSLSDPLTGLGGRCLIGGGAGPPVYNPVTGTGTIGIGDVGGIEPDLPGPGGLSQRSLRYQQFEENDEDGDHSLL